MSSSTCRHRRHRTITLGWRRARASASSLTATLGTSPPWTSEAVPAWVLGGAAREGAALAGQGSPSGSSARCSSLIPFCNIFSLSLQPPQPGGGQWHPQLRPHKEDARVEFPTEGLPHRALIRGNCPGQSHCPSGALSRALSSLVYRFDLIYFCPLGTAFHFHGSLGGCTAEWGC